MAKSSKLKKTLSSDSLEESNKTQAPAPVTSSTEQGDTLLEDLFLDCIKDIYWAENQIVKSLPKMVKAAGSSDLQKAFTQHLQVTLTHVNRLEQVFELMGKKRQAKKCDAMEGITMEAEGMIEDTLTGTSARDVALILAAQKVEHYEIATYGGLVQLAKTLGKQDVADLLAQTLQEEKEADTLLSDIAENSINYKAAAEA